MKTVIVVDDEPFILMIVEDKLKSAGYDVITLRDGYGIMEFIKSQRPDLIIMDWMLPGISGIEVCTVIKQDPETKSIPIFMLTAKGQDVDEKLAMECGIAKYITKPFSPTALLKLVTETIGKAE